MSDKYINATGLRAVIDWIISKLSGKSDTSHKHTKSQITDFPTSLPANGGNADTVDNKHAADFAAASHPHAELSAENIAGQVLNLDSLTTNTTAEKGTTKRYFCPTVSAANITHRPISVNQPFMLEVENIRWANESTYITRQLYTCVSRKKQYERWCTDGAWSRWKALAPLVIYGSVTADSPKTFSYASYGEGYSIVEIKAYYDHPTAGLSNSKAVALTTDTAFERTIITYSATGTSLIFKLENGDITISAVGGSTSLGFRLTYLN